MIISLYGVSKDYDHKSILDRKNEFNKRFLSQWKKEFTPKIEKILINELNSFSKYLIKIKEEEENENSESSESEVEEFEFSEEVLEFCEKVAPPWMNFYCNL